MNRLSMVNLQYLFRFGVVGLCFFFSYSMLGQNPLSLQGAMKIAELGSPSIKRSLLNIEQYQHSLRAERASLKSRFSLTLDPFSYSRNRQFDEQFSQWFTNTGLIPQVLFR